MQINSYKTSKEQIIITSTHPHTHRQIPIHTHMYTVFQVRDVMRSSLINIVKESVEAYKTAPRKEWVIDWPGQVVLAGSQIYWTAEVEEVRFITKLYYGSFMIRTKMCGLGTVI